MAKSAPPTVLQGNPLRFRKEMLKIGTSGGFRKEILCISLSKHIKIGASGGFCKGIPFESPCGNTSESTPPVSFVKESFADRQEAKLAD